MHREIEAQIVRVLRAGIRPTHLDSHQHVHLMPGVFDLTLDLAEAYKIRTAAFDKVIAPDREGASYVYREF